MTPTKSNGLKSTITFGQLLGVGFSILGAIIIFVVMVNVRLAKLENNQASLKDSYNDFGVKMEKFIEAQTDKFDKFTESLNDIKIMLQNKVDKK